MLSNRQTADGVEISAAAEDDLLSASPPAPSRVETPLLRRATAAPTPAPLPAVRAAAAASVDARSTQDQVRADTERLAMSTLSFQDYVRERMLRRQQEESAQTAPRTLQRPAVSARADDGQPVSATAPVTASNVPFLQPPTGVDSATQAATPMATPLAAPPVHALLPAAEGRPTRSVATAATRTAAVAAPAVMTPPDAPQRTAALAATAPGGAASDDLTAHLLRELSAMKHLMEERFNTVAWLGQARLDPVQSQMMLRLVRAGYSAALARAVLSQLQIGVDLDATFHDVLATLESMLAVDPAAPALLDERGIFALVGATGVGKTTTIAKLALQCARAHGAASVGLVTLDAQRAGAHEQLRAFGRGVGIVAHLAHDRDALQEMLGLLSGKQLVLIDTPGISPRDPRRHELHELLDLPAVQRVLVLNAGAHGDTLDEMARTFKGGLQLQAILSKLDEAAKLGPALDTLMRHRFTLRGVTDGQRVPEDWHAPDATELVRSSMQGDRLLPFDPASVDLDYYFSPAACAA